MKFKLAASLASALMLLACNRQPELPLKEVMAKQVQPAAQTYWDAVRYVSDETGDHEIVPKSDADWEKARKAAEDLKKYGELLQSDSYAKGRNDDWKQFAQGLVEIAAQAEQAAKDKSVDKVFEVGGTMYSVCSACHTIYPPPVPPSAKPTDSGEAK